MFIIRRQNYKRSRVFFLLFACVLIGTPLLIAFSLGNNVAPTEIGLFQTVERADPVLLFANNGSTVTVDFNVPLNDKNYWRTQGAQLEFYIYGAEAALPADDDWLDQQVQIRRDDDVAIIVLELDNLPPVFRVKKMPHGYRIELSESGLKGKRIAIDPGHGGHDPGAIGYQIGLMEKDVTLAVGLELQKLLEESGAEVFLTRSTDTLVDTTLEPGKHIRPDLWKRQGIVAQWDPDFFISIHNNSWIDRNTGGIETYYNPISLNSPNSKRAAQLIQDRLVTEIQRRDRGLRYKDSSDAVLQTDNYPSILAEILFISNRLEEQILAEPEFPPQAANALFLGIQDYFNSGGVNR